MFHGNLDQLLLSVHFVLDLKIRKPEEYKKS